MIKKENVKKVMEIATEKPQKKKKKFNSKALRRYLYWFLGLIVSLVPLLAIPFGNKLVGASQEGFFYELFKNNEIFFIGVSLSIAAINDYVQQRQTKKSGDFWTCINIIVIVIGAMFYGITAFVIQHGSLFEIEIDYNFLIWCNIFYLSVIIVLGSYKYVKDILGVK